MTITSPHHHQDIETDVRKDGRVDDRKDTQPVAGGVAGSAFVIVLANHKGGVTKTTSTANLGACLAEAGRRVLLVDCDPQANLSEAFGWTEDLPGERLEDLLAHPAAAVRYVPHQPSRPMPARTWGGGNGCGSSRAPTRRRRCRPARQRG
jgi:Mrp family chromosome partitioning ATPase